MLSNTDLLFKVAVEQEESAPDAAAEIYRQLLEEAPAYVAAHINLGTIHYKRGRLKEALHHYEEAVRVDGKYALARFDLANALDEVGRTEEAQVHYRAAIALDPLYADAHYNLALSLQNAEQYIVALKHWQKYIKIDPNSIDARYAAECIKRIQAATGLHLVRRNPAPQRTPGRAKLELVQGASAGFYRPSTRPTPDAPDGPEAA